MYGLRLRLRSALSLSSPIYQLYRKISSLPLQNHLSPSSAAATSPFPIPRDPSSPVLKLPTDLISKFDYNAYHVWAKVKILTNLSNLDAAAEYARLAVLAVPKSSDDTGTETETEISEICELIIGIMCSEKRFQEAYDLFHYFFNVHNLEPDIDSCSYVVYALCYEGRLDEAIQFYRRTITYAHFPPNPNTLMNALIDAGRIDEAFGLFFGGFTYAVFIRGYLAHGNMEKANELFKDLKQQRESYPNHVVERFAMSQVAYMEHYFKQGKDEEAMELYHSAVAKHCLKQVKYDAANRCDKRADTVNTVLQVLLNYGKKKEAWSLFDNLCGNTNIDEDERSDKETRCIMMRECFETGDISNAMKIARKETRCSWAEHYGFCTTLIKILVRHGMMSEAEEMFSEMFSPQRIGYLYDSEIYRMMVDGFAKAGKFDDAHRFVNKMADISLSHVAVHVHSASGRDFVI